MYANIVITVQCKLEVGLNSTQVPYFLRGLIFLNGSTT